MYDITRFTLADMTKCGSDLRKIGNGSKSMEEVSNRIVNYFYENFIDKETNQNSFALVRLYKTHPYEKLNSDLQDFIIKLMEQKPYNPKLKCLVLLATKGLKNEWCKRELSEGHKAIPLVSEQKVLAIPMISNLLKQFGIEIKNVVESNIENEILLVKEQYSFNVFYVPNALGSEYIPAQNQFVIPEKIKSCLGFGGILPSLELFSVIIFSKTFISNETASMFKSLSLNVKIALMEFESKIFSS